MTLVREERASETDSGVRKRRGCTGSLHRGEMSGKMGTEVR